MRNFKKLSVTWLFVFSLFAVPIQETNAYGFPLWTVVKEGAFSLASYVYGKFFSDSVDPQEFEALQRQLNSVKQSVQNIENSGNYPPADFQSVKQLVWHLQYMMNAMNVVDYRVSSLEQRMAAVERRLDALEQRRNIALTQHVPYVQRFITANSGQSYGNTYSAPATGYGYPYGNTYSAPTNGYYYNHNGRNSLDGLTCEQIVGLTDEQLNALTTEQLRIIARRILMQCYPILNTK